MAKKESISKLDVNLFFRLLNMVGVSGNEENIRNLIKKEITPYVDEIKVDKFGNLIARKKGPKPTVMLAAHMDEVGLMVKHIHKKTGKIDIAAIGGLDTAVLIGQLVTVDIGKDKKINGIISSEKLSTGKTIDELPEFKDLFVDTGLSKKELNELGVKEGTPITFSPSARYLGNDRTVASKAIDDRAGCFILLELAKRLKKSNCEVIFVFTVQEEVGLYGARTSTYSIQPDWGIAIDVADAEDCDEDPILSMGGGPVLTVRDSELISNTCINEWIEKISKRKNIPIQKNVSELGTTDATNISLSRGGVPSTVLGVCIRNMHSAVGIVSLDDIEKTVMVLHELMNDPARHCEVH